MTYLSTLEVRRSIVNISVKSYKHCDRRSSTQSSQSANFGFGELNFWAMLLAKREYTWTPPKSRSRWLLLQVHSELLQHSETSYNPDPERRGLRLGGETGKSVPNAQTSLVHRPDTIPSRRNRRLRSLLRRIKPRARMCSDAAR